MATPKPAGTLLLFQVRGISVFLHWSWFLVAGYEIMLRRSTYSSLLWNALEYVALFVIVLLHEFGHAFACRQVGGHAERILLWPLGGIAYVSPPQRPGAVLWSIAAGPLVNVVLLFVIMAVSSGAKSIGLWQLSPDLQEFVRGLGLMNAVLLVFNLLPAYPLDGGQILRALLWFAVGRATSLRIVAVIGAVGALLLIWFAIGRQSLLTAAIGVFALARCWSAFGEAKALGVLGRAPRRVDAACPACAAPPPLGPIWVCGACRRPFDVHAGGGACPHCNAVVAMVSCTACEVASPLASWRQSPWPDAGAGMG